MAERLLEEHVAVGEVLGSGGFSTVRLGQTREGQLVAVKTLSKHGRYGSGDVPLIRNEIQVMALILERVDNPHVVKLLDVFDDAESVHLVVELCTGGELFQSIVQRGHYSERHAALVIRQMASGLAALHAVDILHRDLKPENVLFVTSDSDSLLKIMDFGLSFVQGSEDVMVGLIGSIDYIAPEVLSTRKYHKGSDVWSLGVILYILICGRPPFRGESVQEKQKHILAADFSFQDRVWETVSPQVMRLLDQILVRDPDARPTAEDVLNHSWVRDGGEARSDPLPMEVPERLLNFNAKRKFKAAVYASIAASSRIRMLQRGLSALVGETHFSKRELLILYDSFKSVVGSDTSLVNLEQLKTVIEKVNIDFSPGLLPRLYELFDLNSDGQMDFRELVCGLSNLRVAREAGPVDEETLRFIFELYDEDGSGGVTPEELGKVLAATSGNKDMDPWTHAARTHDLFVAMDTNADGIVSFEEFKEATKNLPSLLTGILGDAGRVEKRSSSAPIALSPQRCSSDALSGSSRSSSDIMDMS